MIRFVRMLAAAASVALLAGCAGPVAVPETVDERSGEPSITTVDLEFDGAQRSFRVTVPPGDGDDLPVLVALHGAGGSAVTLSYLTGFDRHVEDAGFLLVEPNGTGPDPGSRTWNAGTCCGSSVDAVDDVGFLAAVLDRVASDHDIDEERVFLAGFSNGGMLAYRAACELGDRIAGIAVVAGTMNVEECPAPDPVPVLAIHGTADSVVPFEGGTTTYNDPRVAPWYNVPVEEAVGFWAERNGCAAPAERTVGPARVHEWPDCSVALWVIDGGGHTWFGSPMSVERGAEPPGTPSATDLALGFFGLADPAG